LGQGRGNKTKNQDVIGASRSGASGPEPKRRLGTNEKWGQPAILMPPSDQKAALFFYLAERYFMSQCSVTLCCFFSRLPAVRTKARAPTTPKAFWE
jgi:hypothetical protein